MRPFLALLLLLIAACAPAQEAVRGVDGYDDIKFSFNAAKVAEVVRLRTGTAPPVDHEGQYQGLSFGWVKGQFIQIIFKQQIMFISMNYYLLPHMPPGAELWDAGKCERMLASIQADFEGQYGPARVETGMEEKRPFTRLLWQSDSGGARAVMYLDSQDKGLCGSIHAMIHPGSWEELQRNLELAREF